MREIACTMKPFPSLTAVDSVLPRLVTFVFLGLGIAAISGCATQQKVIYSMDEVQRVRTSPVVHVSLVIAPLKDERKSVADNSVLFRSGNETTIDKSDVCINSESGYEPDPISDQIAGMLAAHLRSRGALPNVTVGTRRDGAYFLTGTLRRFFAMQKSTATSATTWVLFGAVGAAVAGASNPDEIPGRVSIEIVDLVLYDATGRRVMKLPDIRHNEQLAMRSAADCLIVYDNINLQLKRAFDRYAGTIELSIRDTQSASQVPISSKPLPQEVPPPEPW